MSTLLGKGTTKKSGANFPTVQDFLDFFNKKVDVCRATGGGLPESHLHPAPAVLQFYLPYIIDEIRNVISGASSKTCARNPIPSHLVKAFLTELLSFIIDIWNTSLLEGCLPVSQWHAIVTSRLKKADMNPCDAKNYRPVSNLTCMSKIIEKLVCRQLVAYFEQHSLISSYQAA